MLFDIVLMHRGFNSDSKSHELTVIITLICRLSFGSCFGELINKHFNQGTTILFVIRRALTLIRILF